MSKLITVSDMSIELLEELAQLTGKSQQKLVEQAILVFYHQQQLKKANKQYAQLEGSSGICKVIVEEEIVWDSILLDGLEDKE